MRFRGELNENGDCAKKKPREFDRAIEPRGFSMTSELSALRGAIRRRAGAHLVEGANRFDFSAQRRARQIALEAQ
jgi:hypothetical protein